ncbi:MAG: hypothetical protein LWW94_02000 [Candidatus Desulfofervidaceae bacterium]|nr:hypothetical protein [Candidatus Desulfofervidaceae bacterium]
MGKRPYRKVKRRNSPAYLLFTQLGAAGTDGLNSLQGAQLPSMRLPAAQPGTGSITPTGVKDINYFFDKTYKNECQE